jgi:patatin-like phospholipase/acyl hydrolase
MSKFRILSIDGGGLRGIVPLSILKEIEKRTGKRVHELFDMMVGTSTGGLIASCLTLRKEGTSQPLYTLEELSKMYTEYGSTIFPVQGTMGKIFRKANNLVNPKYDDKGIDKVLKKFISEQRIKDAIRPIIISTYDLNQNETVFFKSSEANEYNLANPRIYDICRATSAAPTYLPAYSFTYKGKMLTGIDGGVYINNPTMAAIAEISKYGQTGFYKKSDGSKVAFEDISILSLGTGSYTGSISREQAVSWGQLQWITCITDIMMRGVNQTTDYEAKEMIEANQYLRLSISIGDEKFSDMCDARPETQKYLMEEVDKQIFSNQEKNESLNDFIKSQLIGTRTVISPV